jgi:hypothetical protein
MADLVVSCPECKKKFKPKTDVQGKKIKCPFCTHPFVVPAAAAAAVEAPEAKPRDEYEADPDPYGVQQVELVPRCPNCTTEMGEHDTICLECGYNTITRSWGKTEKIVGLTFGRHFLYLLPALGAAVFVFFTIVGLIFSATVTPYFWGENSWMRYTDTEAVKMWSTLINLLWIWGAGVYCFKKFIEKPKPDDIKLE